MLLSADENHQKKDYVVQVVCYDMMNYLRSNKRAF